MSLILEALKKSEANRRLGQAPDLGTPFSPAQRERSPLWALIVIVLALGFGAWWWFGGSTPAPATPKSLETTAAPAQAKKTAPIRSAPAQAMRPRSPEPVVQDTAAMGFGPLPPGSAQQTENEDQRVFYAARRAEQAAAMAQNQAARQHAPVRQTAPAPVMHAPAPPAPAVHVSAPPAPTVSTAPVVVAAPSATAAATPDSPAAPTPHPATSPQPSAPGVVKSDIQSYYDLPFATRKALPALSMSMHVYTADPKQRFIILDGTRLAEGDSTPDNVSLREIRPDGVILEFQGQRFFFPRDGH